MNAETQKQLQLFGETFKRAIEERDPNLLASIIDRKTVLHAFGDFGDGEDAVALFGALTDHVEELSVNIGDFSKFKESKDTISVAVPVDLSFVDTTTWQLRRYRASLALCFERDDRWVLRILSLNSLEEIGGKQPGALDTPGGASDLGMLMRMPEAAAFVGTPGFMRLVGGVSELPPGPLTPFAGMPAVQLLPVWIVRTPAGPMILQPVNPVFTQPVFTQPGFTNIDAFTIGGVSAEGF